jgi:rhodanese-related sulfurtransferase
MRAQTRHEHINERIKESTTKRINERIIGGTSDKMEHMYHKITFEEAKELLDKQPNHLILDVREEKEYITGHAEGAALFPVDSINAETAAKIIPSPDTLLFVYCRSGKRSKMAAERLLELGYTHVYDLGSLVGWPYGMAW